ncbi:hypothetical protein C8R44DRAFT_609060 [Mycena epipterygia]|nr:hypothetical protein C8R44DRAFT_609060 [Mycena epipterygia]
MRLICLGKRNKSTHISPCSRSISHTTASIQWYSWILASYRSLEQTGDVDVDYLLYIYSVFQEYSPRTRAQTGQFDVFYNLQVNSGIPPHIKIAAEAEPIRTLGAWVGNGVEQVETWARTLEKMDAALDQWELGHPAMEGRRHIILMVVGGIIVRKSQFT